MKPEELEYLKMWLMQFHDYVGKHRAGMRLANDFPKLLALYEESRPLYNLLRDKTPLSFRLLLEGDEALLLVNDVPVECVVERSVPPR